MDIQLKRGLLDVCVLRAIKDEPSYGYKIITDISELIEISESTLYPILRRLEANNLLETYNENYNGRIRKYYKITKLGIDKIDAFLDEWKNMERVIKFIRTREWVYE